MCLLGAGKKPREVADLLVIDESTIRTYKRRIRAKMGFTNDADLIRYYVETMLPTG